MESTEIEESFARLAIELARQARKIEDDGAGGGNRTLTGGDPHGILSPARLPVSPLRRSGKVNLQYSPNLVRERHLEDSAMVPPSRDAHQPRPRQNPKNRRNALKMPSR